MTRHAGLLVLQAVNVACLAALIVLPLIMLGEMTLDGAVAILIVVLPVTMLPLIRHAMGRRFVRRLARRIPSAMAENRVAVSWNQEGVGSSARRIPIGCGLTDHWNDDATGKFNAARPFVTTIQDGANSLRIEHGRNGDHIRLEVPGPDGERISEVLVNMETGRVAETVERHVLAAYAKVLGVRPRIYDVAERVIVGTRIETGRQWAALEGTDIRLIATKVGKRGKWTRREIWLVSPTMGVLHLPDGTMEKAQARRRRTYLDAAMGAGTIPAPTMPVLIGSPKIAKTVAMAYRLIERYPDLSDSYGTRITPLVREHLPRLIERHEAAMRAATTGTIIDEEKLRQIDGEFEEGLGVIESALAEGLELEQHRSRQDLGVEIAFLRSRHPVNLAETLTSVPHEKEETARG